MLREIETKRTSIPTEPHAMLRPYFETYTNSPAPVTLECDEIICSTSVVPDLGIPTMKIELVYFVLCHI